MLAVRDLRKSYDGRVAVDGLSFEIARGETFGLLGPNGAGKSTTIHAITGLLKPDSGSIALDCKEDPTRPEVRQRLGLAPQALALYAELSAEENVEFFGRLQGLGGKLLAERVDSVLDTAGLTDRRRDVVGTFSGGMQRR